MTTASLPATGSFEKAMTDALKQIKFHPSAKAEQNLRRAVWLAAGAADAWVSAFENVNALHGGWHPGMRPSQIVDELLSKAISGHTDALMNMAKMADNAVEELTEHFERSEFMPLIS